MKELILVKYAPEIFLKGLNRGKFEKKLRDNICKKLENIKVEFTDNVVNNLSEKGFDKVYGARPLRRLITSEIEDMLSEKYLSGELKQEKYICDYKNKRFIIKEKSLVL